MRYEIQILSKRLKWRTQVRDAGNLDNAIDQVLKYGAGNFPSYLRIVCDGNVVMNSTTWKLQQKG